MRSGVTRSSIALLQSFKPVIQKEIAKRFGPNAWNQLWDGPDEGPRTLYNVLISGLVANAFKRGHYFDAGALRALHIEIPNGVPDTCPVLTFEFSDEQGCIATFDVDAPS